MIWIARMVLRLLARLPQQVPLWAARRCAPVWMYFSPVKRRVAKVNLRACYPDLDPQARGRLHRESFVHYVCSVLETGRNACWPLERLGALCDGVENADALSVAVASGRGVLILAPHFGAWEYLGLYLQMHFSMAILYKPSARPDLERAIAQMRGRAGGRMLPATPAGLRKLRVHIGNGGVGAILPDQEPSAGRGRFAPFFGRRAFTGVLAPRLLRGSGCVALFMVSQRLESGRYRVHVISADEKIYSADMDEALAAVNRGVERCIAVAPAQYLWSYKRFRSRPGDEPPTY